MKLLFTILLCGSLFTASAYAQFNKANLATKLGLDSTIFTLTLDAKHPPKPGQPFKATIHVAPGADWHVYSSKMTSDGGLTPLTLKVPPEISEYFEISNIDESGALRTSYDSNFMAVTMAHYTPFDLIVTMKVLKKADKEVPFYLLVHYQTCTETMCMPPRTFAVPMTVLGQGPLKLKLAESYLYSPRNVKLG
jgi:hypothetical protein